MEGGKPGNPAKNPHSKVRTNNRLKPHWHWTGEGSHGKVTWLSGLGCYPEIPASRPPSVGHAS